MGDDVNTGVPVHVASSGPYNRNVMLPPAATPAAPLMIGLPGCVAVPPSVAVSEIELPTVTAADACVMSVGVTGSTSKHSPVLLGGPADSVDASVASGTPCVVASNSAYQQ
jgi:hypothetical protein